MERNILNADIRALAASDPDVAAGLAQVGPPEPRAWPHGFPTLLRILVNQQLSTHAAAAIMGRLEALVPGLSPEGFLARDAESLRAAGMSGRKVDFGRRVARAVADGALDLDALRHAPDAVERLRALPGFGLWSAEIYALFALGRRDIFPAGDLALREALRRLKSLPERPQETAARALTDAWAPRRSAGALFLWRYYRGAPS